MSQEPTIPVPGENYREGMIEYIRYHFSDLLGAHAALLDQDDGLDRLSDLVRCGAIGRR